MDAIETHALTKRFGQKCVVDGLALRVPRRCVYGFLGPNGAGKTTTMRLLLGLIRADAGNVRLLGHDLARARNVALRQVGAFVESPSLYDHLSGRANLDITRRLLGLQGHAVDQVLDIVDLRHAADARVATYSLGMKQRLALARALLGSPPLLLLDEPTNGLDPDGIIAMRDLIRALPERTGGTVFVSSHLLAEVEQIATVVGLMRGGRLVLQGEVAALLGGHRTIRIDLDDARRGVDLLRAAGLTVTICDARSLLLSCPAVGAIREITAHANRELVAAGLSVFAITPEAQTLEQVYRRSEAGSAEAIAA